NPAVLHPAPRRRVPLLPARWSLAGCSGVRRTARRRLGPDRLRRKRRGAAAAGAGPGAVFGRLPGRLYVRGLVGRGARAAGRPLPRSRDATGQTTDRARPTCRSHPAVRKHPRARSLLGRCLPAAHARPHAPGQPASGARDLRSLRAQPAHTPQRGAADTDDRAVRRPAALRKGLSQVNSWNADTIYCTMRDLENLNHPWGGVEGAPRGYPGPSTPPQGRGSGAGCARPRTPTLGCFEISESLTTKTQRHKGLVIWCLGGQTLVLLRPCCTSCKGRRRAQRGARRTWPARNHIAGFTPLLKETIV